MGWFPFSERLDCPNAICRNAGKPTFSGPKGTFCFLDIQDVGDRVVLESNIFEYRGNHCYWKSALFTFLNSPPDVQVNWRCVEPAKRVSWDGGFTTSHRSRYNIHMCFLTWARSLHVGELYFHVQWMNNELILTSLLHVIWLFLLISLLCLLTVFVFVIVYAECYHTHMPIGLFCSANRAFLSTIA